MSQPLFFSELAQFLSIPSLSQSQREYFERLQSIIKEIEVVSVYDVFSESEIQRIKRLVKPEQGQCFKNAQRLVSYFPNVLYSECRLDVANVLSVDHAINKVGNSYVDITLELCLHQNPASSRYTLIRDFTLKEVRDVQLKTQSYVSIYEYIYRFNKRK